LEPSHWIALVEATLSASHLRSGTTHHVVVLVLVESIAHSTTHRLAVSKGIGLETSLLLLLLLLLTSKGVCLSELTAHGHVVLLHATLHATEASLTSHLVAHLHTSLHLLTEHWLERLLLLLLRLSLSESAHHIVVLIGSDHAI
jgi:hypothetical protein